MIDAFSCCFFLSETTKLNLLVSFHKEGCINFPVIYYLLCNVRSLSLFRPCYITDPNSVKKIKVSKYLFIFTYHRYFRVCLKYFFLYLLNFKYLRSIEVFYIVNLFLCAKFTISYLTKTILHYLLIREKKQILHYHFRFIIDFTLNKFFWHITDHLI